MQNERSILTYTGKLFDFWEPTPDMVCIEDIAHALALTNRYNGHTYQPYSVAEHCERMSYISTAHPLVSLLHDAAEAYVGDIASPQKRRLWWDFDLTGATSFREQENKIIRVIGEALSLRDLESNVKSKGVKEADLIMLATEARDLMPESSIYTWWTKEVEPLEEKIYPLHWALVEDQFLTRYEELTGRTI
jgi:5'-deoxynucleotidase YfbR-like HD superfamily hydrolase